MLSQILAIIWENLLMEKLIKDSFDLCEIFLNEAYVATIPGDGFGAPGYVRFSYAIDEKTIEGIDRVKKIIDKSLNYLRNTMKLDIHPDYIKKEQ